MGSRRIASVKSRTAFSRSSAAAAFLPVSISAATFGAGTRSGGRVTGSGGTPSGIAAREFAVASVYGARLGSAGGSSGTPSAAEYVAPDSDPSATESESGRPLDLVPAALGSPGWAEAAAGSAADAVGAAST